MNDYATQKQRGVALVVSMIILISLTMLGLTAIQRTTVDLAMAGNQREIGLMFQAAEVGLVEAEDFIDASTSNADFNDPDLGLYDIDDNASNPAFAGPNYFNNAGWLAASQTAATSLDAVEQPRYMIEFLGDRFQNPLAAIQIDDYTSPKPGDIASIYRSTARGAGLTGNSYRYLQSYYGKAKP